MDQMTVLGSNGLILPLPRFPPNPISSAPVPNGSLCPVASLARNSRWAANLSSPKTSRLPIPEINVLPATSHGRLFSQPFLQRQSATKLTTAYLHQGMLAKDSCNLPLAEWFILFIAKASHVNSKVKTTDQCTRTRVCIGI